MHLVTVVQVTGYPPREGEAKTIYDSQYGFALKGFLLPAFIIISSNIVSARARVLFVSFYESLCS